ncbi:MAG TPA: hypothetical protein VFN87_05660 [Solirubrobacteraceae bacterium]|nr:hypothetical protein [Solirubrobacteraceae bacterium]
MAQPEGSFAVVAVVFGTARSDLLSRRWLRAAFVLAASALLALGTAAGARAARAPVLAADPVIDGPDAAIVSVNGMSIARDGTGGVVYLKDVAGIPHVFVSVLSNGSFQAPVQVDPGLLAGSSQAVIAAGNGGTLLVGFINNGALYVAQRLNGGAFAPPAALYPAAANPSISMSNFGKAYLAFTATNGAGGGDVRTAYSYQGQWALEPTPLDDNPADAAGTGSGRPQVATAGDGTAIVAWGENGHVYTRRVVKTTASVVDEQADVPSVDGWSEVSAGDPVIAAGGDSTYAAVAFQEQITNGGSQQSRVLLNRLHGSQYDGASEADGAVTGGPEGADQPQTSNTEYGDGWVVSEHDSSHQLFGTVLGGNDSFRTTERIDSLANANPPYAVSSNAGLLSTFIAWQQDPGSAGPAEIRLRFAPNGSDLGPEQVISSPSYGAANAAAGLQAAGDVAGDAAAAWVQGSGAATRIVAAQLYQPPGGFVASNAFRYSTTATPTLAWSSANELWGSPQYSVTVNGAVVGQTGATQLTTPVLRNGRDVYQVTAVNQGGVATASRPATVFVDTVRPRATLRITGIRAVRDRLRLIVRSSDPAPPGQPRSQASGVATVFVRWGDGSRPQRIRRTLATHIYRRRRTYTIAVTVTDRAGNRTVVRKRIKIFQTAPRSHRRHRPGRKAHARGRAQTAHVVGARMTFSTPAGR